MFDNPDFDAMQAEGVSQSTLCTQARLWLMYSRDARMLLVVVFFFSQQVKKLRDIRL